MAQEFPFRIVTPAGVVFTGTVSRVTLCNAGGSFSVLANHAPLIAGLAAQTAQWEDGGGIHRFTLSGGVAEVSGQGLTILAPEAAV
ncbi:MAG: F0F1 ATP synthase subunit epsilon [Oscillibacter sp.]